MGLTAAGGTSVDFDGDACGGGGGGGGGRARGGNVVNSSFLYG